MYEYWYFFSLWRCEMLMKMQQDRK